MLVLLVADERRLEVEVGAGLNSAYAADGRGARVQSQRVVPLLKAGRTGDALVAAAEEYAALVAEVDAAGAYDPVPDFEAEAGYTIARCVHATRRPASAARSQPARPTTRHADAASFFFRLNHTAPCSPAAAACWRYAPTSATRS